MNMRFLYIICPSTNEEYNIKAPNKQQATILKLIKNSVWFIFQSLDSKLA